MAEVTGVLCQIITGNVDGAGTDGRVYLGLGGREFRLDSSEDDYERSSWREYILGRGPVEPNLPPPQIRVLNPNRNDPRKGYVLDTAMLSRAPVYVRFEPEGSGPDWNLRSAIVLVYTGEGQFVVAYFAAAGFDNLWLGDGYGKILYLIQDWWRDERTLLEAGRRLAKLIGADETGRP
jgi:hypothetical protein